MTVQETFRVPRELQPTWDLTDTQSEITLQESIRESEFVEELTHRFSDESPQSGPTPPGIETVRRSPVWLFRSSQLPKKDLQAFIPELNVRLDHVTHLPDGRLEFSKKVTGLCLERVILQGFPRATNENSSSLRIIYKRNDFTKKAGMKRLRNITALHDSIQKSWADVGNAAPYPNLDAIVVSGGKLHGPQPLVGIQFPESIMAVEDLDWGGCRRLSWDPTISENMIDRASIWIDDDHPILSDFKMLISPPETGPALHANSNKDILRNHLLKRNWIWITRMHHLKRVIDIPRTEEFYDARMAFFNHGSPMSLQMFCQRHQCTERQLGKRSCHIRGKLGHLMLMSQVAEMEMTGVTAVAQERRKRAAEFGPWLDFLVNSTRNGNDRLSSPLEALEAARYFISAVRLGLNPHRIPEARHVERESNWVEEWIKSRSEERKLTWSNKQKEFILNRLAGRGSEPLTDWQLTGEKLYNLQAFCPQTEARCALALLLHHQELAVLRKEASKTKGQEKLPASPPLGRVPICQCHSEDCQYQESHPLYSIRFHDKSHYCSMGGSGNPKANWSSSSETNPIAEVNISVESSNKSSSPPLHCLFPEAVGTALSVISEEKSQPSTPRLEQFSSKPTVAIATHSGQVASPEALSASNNAKEVSQQNLIANASPAGQITPPSESPASIAVQEDPQQSYLLSHKALLGSIIVPQKLTKQMARET
jgi:hypothetical protein